MTGPELEALRREVRDGADYESSVHDALERRIIALEEILAVRWPARILAAARLGRKLRESVRHFPGDSFAERRAEAATIEWHADQDEGLL